MLGTCGRCLSLPTEAASRASAAMPGRKQLTGLCSSRRCGIGCTGPHAPISLTDLGLDKGMDLALILDQALDWELDQILPWAWVWA